MRRHGLTPKLGALAAVGLLCLFGSFYELTHEIFFRVQISRVCTPAERDHCFSTRRGVVRQRDDRKMEVGFDEKPYRETLYAYDRWERPPVPGSPVLLHRWEGGEVAYVTDLRTGRRHRTVNAPDRAQAAIGVVVFAGIGGVILWAVACEAKRRRRHRVSE